MAGAEDWGASSSGADRDINRAQPPRQNSAPSQVTPPALGALPGGGKRRQPTVDARTGGGTDSRTPFLNPPAEAASPAATRSGRHWPRVTRARDCGRGLRPARSPTPVAQPTGPWPGPRRCAHCAGQRCRRWRRAAVTALLVLPGCGCCSMARQLGTHALRGAAELVRSVRRPGSTVRCGFVLKRVLAALNPRPESSGGLVAFMAATMRRRVCRADHGPGWAAKNLRRAGRVRRKTTHTADTGRKPLPCARRRSAALNLHRA